MNTVYPYLESPVEESIIYQNCNPTINIPNSSLVPWMAHSSYKDTRVYAQRYSQRALHTNICGVPNIPVRSYVLTLANMGYVPPFFHIQDKLSRVIPTFFFPKPASANQNFGTFPNNFAFVPANSPTCSDQQRNNGVSFYDRPSWSCSQNKQSIHPDTWFARNIVPYQQNQRRPQFQLHHLKCASPGQGVGMVSSTTVGLEGQYKYNKTLISMGQGSSFAQKDALPETTTCPVHIDENDLTSTKDQVLNQKSLNSFTNKKKSKKFNITSKEDDNGSIGKKSSKIDLPLHSPNPNGRGRTASVISEISSTLSFESKEAEIVKDPMFLSFSSPRSPSDEISRSPVLSTPASQKPVSDVSVLDSVVNSQSLPVFNCEAAEPSSPRLLSIGVTMPESSSKPIISKPLHFIIEPKINENSWQVVSHRKKREHIKMEPVKPQCPSPPIFSELVLPKHSETSKKCRKRKKKNKRKPHEQKKLQATVRKEEGEQPDVSKPLRTTCKYRKSICNILGEYIFSVITLWSIKSS